MYPKSTHMKKILLAEEAAELATAVFALYMQPIHLSWWLWPIVFLAPDISMLGYFINTKIGAISYNLFHHKLFAIAVLVAGYFGSNDITLLMGLLLFAHACFDKLMGYGLKYPDSFNNTHLGKIGKAK